MKKLIIVLLTLFFTTVSYAETITVINSGKAGGSFNARTQMYKDGLIEQGYNVVFLNIGKISQAVKMFKEADEPTIMVYSTNQVYKQALFHTTENFIMLEYQQPLYICRTNTSKDKKLSRKYFLIIDRQKLSPRSQAFMFSSENKTGIGQILS